MVVKRLAVIITALILPIAAQANDGKVEAIGALTDGSASESVRNALASQGYRVSLGDGTHVCDIWLRKAIPTQAKTDLPGVMLAEVAESTLVGVISFPKDTRDFRGQTVKTGTYTMRYALHPVDGDHLGISVYRDFLLLVPLGDDQNADAQLKFEDLANMSKKVSGTNHPAPLDIVYPESQDTAAKVVTNELDHLIFVGKLKTQAGADVPFALIVKGVAEQ